MNTNRRKINIFSWKIILKVRERMTERGREREGFEENFPKVPE